MNAMKDAFRQNDFWIYDDGGLTKSPLRIQNNMELGGTDQRADCVIRSMAIVFERSYEEVWDRVYQERQARSQNGIAIPKFGISDAEYIPILKEWGWNEYPIDFWEDVLVQDVFLALSFQHEVKELLLVIDGHIASYKNGFLRDCWDCSMEPVETIYGDRRNFNLVLEYLEAMELVSTIYNG